MNNIITDVEVLKKPSEVVKFYDLSKANLDEDQSKSCNETISKIKEVLNSRDDLLALAAPQIGINKRIFCVKFGDGIKSFINPVVTKKSKERFINFEKSVYNEKHFYICRPNEIEAVFYTDGLNYESNLFKDEAAALFMRYNNLLDGILEGAALEIDSESITANDIPTIIDAAYSGSGVFVEDDLMDLSEIATKLSAYMDAFEACIEDLCSDNNSDGELRKVAREFRLFERTALGDTTSIDRTNLKKNIRNANRAAKGARRAEFSSFIKNKMRK